LIAALACRLCGFVKRKQFERGYKIIMKKNKKLLVVFLLRAKLLSAIQMELSFQMNQ